MNLPVFGSARLLLLTVLAAAAWAAPADRPSNIVFILADDLGWNSIGPNGNKEVATPHIDRLAREGLTLRRAYVEAQCSPTRGAFFSGQWPARTGMFAVTHEMDPVGALLTPPAHSMGLTPETASLALMLRGAGYTNGLSGKWHIADNYNAAPLRARDGGSYFDRYGFDFVGEAANGAEKDKSAAGITEDLLGFMERNRARPFFAFFAHHSTHSPMEAPRALVDKYAARGFKRSSTPLFDFGERPTADYYAMVEHLDVQVGRVLAKLEALGLAQHTLVIFTTDNGGLNRMADMAPLRGAKGMPYEGGVRVPCVMRWPGRIAAGTVSDVPIHVVDYYPTFAAIAGAKLAPNRRVDGANLVPLLTERKPPPRDTLYWHMPTYTTPFGRTPCASILRGNWKLIHYFGDFLDVTGGKPENEGVYGKLIIGPRTELYDLGADEGESTDLAAREPAKVAELMVALQKFWADTGAARPSPNLNYRADNPAWWKRATGQPANAPAKRSADR